MQNQIIYIGKAKNLKKRLHQYSTTKDKPQRIVELIRSIAHTRYKTFANEWLSLLAEAQLIKKHQPHFNVRLKDDKSNLYLAITDELYPRVLLVRKSNLNTSPIPLKKTYGPFISASVTKDILKLSRRLFPFCNQSRVKHTHPRPCFYYHLNLCPGVCLDQITPGQYRQTIHRLMLFLSGKHKLLYRNLHTAIRRASEKQAFEEAAGLKKTIQLLQNIQMLPLSASMALPELVAPSSQDQYVKLNQFLSQILDLPPNNSFSRIECYDCANLQGLDATVSMVVLTDGVPNPSAYRHFSIKNIQTPNDFLMLAQAIKRRQNHPEWGMPDLILVDGGLPQIQAVARILQWPIPLVGLAKHPDRLIIPTKDFHDSLKTIPLNSSDTFLRPLIQIRNESHRFARRLHHLHHDQRLKLR